MDKYEYRGLQGCVGNTLLINRLNELGAEGWHVVGMTPSSYEVTPQTTIDGYRGIIFDIILERKITQEF